MPNVSSIRSRYRHTYTQSEGMFQKYYGSDLSKDESGCLVTSLWLSNQQQVTSLSERIDTRSGHNAGESNADRLRRDNPFHQDFRPVAKSDPKQRHSFTSNQLICARNPDPPLILTIQSILKLPVDSHPRAPCPTASSPCPCMSLCVKENVSHMEGPSLSCTE